MPAYEYLCEACECRFERRQKMSDPALDECPECGGSVRRLISGGAGAITKGSSAAPQPMCASGGPCCGQGAGCGNRMSCDNLRHPFPALITNH
jgi:putative FmdB family regulatory protein